MTGAGRVISLAALPGGRIVPPPQTVFTRAELDRALRAAEWDRAADISEKLLEETPESRDLRAALAECRLRTEDWESAAREYAVCLSLDPDNAQVMVRLAVCHLHAGRPALAQALADRAARAGAGGCLAIELRERLASSADAGKADAGKPSAGKNDLRCLVIEVKGRSEAGPVGERLWEEAQAAQVSGREEEVRVRLEELVMLDPECLPARVELARWHQLRGHTAEAARLYEAALRQEPEAWEAAYNLALLREEEGESGEAIALLESALLLAPDCVQAARALALMYEHRRHDRAARFWWGRVTAVDRGDRDGWLRQGTLEAKAGQLKAAAAAFVVAARAGGGFEASYNAGVCQAARGEMEAARHAWEEAHELNPARPEAPLALAALALDGGEVEEAARWVRELVESGQEPPDLLFPLAAELERSGATRRASIYWRLICQIRPGWADALVNLGAALRDAGEEAAAREAWLQALEADPELAPEYFG